MSKSIIIVDGNNQFPILHQRAISYDDLCQKAKELTRSADQVFWVFDGFDSRKPRRDLYPTYKAQRKKKEVDTHRYELLNNFKTDGLRSIGGVVGIEVPYYEADDVMTTLVKTLKGAQIQVLTTDADLKRLEEIDGVSVPQAKLPEGVALEHLHLYKTLVGDTSDNIKGVVGLGKSTWATFTRSELDVLAIAIAQNTPYYIHGKVAGKWADKIVEQWDNVQLWYRLVEFIDIDPVHFNSATMVSYPKLAPQPINMRME